MKIDDYFDIKSEQTRTPEEKNLIEQLGVKHHIADLFFPEEHSYSQVERLTKFITHIADKDIYLRRKNAIHELQDLLKKDENAEEHLTNLMNIHIPTRAYNSLNPREWMPQFYDFTNASFYFRDKLASMPHCKIFSEEINKLIEGIPSFSQGKYWSINMRGIHDLNNRQTKLISDYELKTKSRILYQEINETMTFPLSDSAVLAIEHMTPIRYALDSLMTLAKILNKSEKENGDLILAEVNTTGLFEVEIAKPLGEDFGVEHSWFRKKIYDPRVPYSLRYDETNNHFIYSGNHSGGKTVRLQSIGAKYLLASSAIPLRMKKGNIPLVNNIYSFIEIENESKRNKGALEEEIHRMVDLSKNLKDNDLVLIDEFLDTTKPELGKYIASNLLSMLGESKSAIHIMYHAANHIDFKTNNFRCFYPEIKYKLKKEEKLVPLNDSEYANKSHYVETGKKIKEYYPTRKFIEGLPDPNIIKKHTEQLWKQTIEEQNRYL